MNPGKKGSSRDKDEYVVTSFRLKKSTHQAAKVYAVEHDVKLQEVVDEALRRFLNLE